MTGRAGPYARLTVHSEGVLLLKCAYSPELNEALRLRLPRSGRRWDPDARGWRIDAQYGQMVADFCGAFLGVAPSVPSVSLPVGPPPRETRLFEVRYLGRAKERAPGEWTASGWVRSAQPGFPVTHRGRGGWDLILTLQALRRHFEPSYALRDPGDDEDEPAAPDSVVLPPSLYDVLGVAADADETALKAAFKALVRQWHPDVCREPDAHERFIAIQDAYDVLRDPAVRQRYDSGLRFEREAQAAAAFASPTATPLAALGLGGSTWAPPRRSGFFLVTGRPSVAGFRATHVLDVRDIVDPQGAVHVASWPRDGDDFDEAWVLP